MKDLPETELDVMVDVLTYALEKHFDRSIDELEKLSDDEFDALLKTI